MPGNLVACAYALFAITGAYVLLSLSFPDKKPEIIMVYISWALITCVAFLAPHPFIYFFCCGCCHISSCACGSTRHRTVLLRHDAGGAHVYPLVYPFPGLQQLFMLDHYDPVEYGLAAATLAEKKRG